MMSFGGAASGVLPHTPPPWSRRAVWYEVNVRQITREGTLAAFREQKMPQLREMGVDVLWFMPIHPIGCEGRKGTLGSYYSIRDYTAVNPEFGTLEDFKQCVEAAHDLGMYVVMDWVAAHTARDAVWLTHTDWYHRNEDGTPAYLYNWSDVARLNYDNAQLREAMYRAMRFWIDYCHIDGFRCDMAHLTPLDFWEWVVPRLQAVKPSLFFLAESEMPQMTYKAFHSFYAWDLHHTLNAVARGEKDMTHLWGELEALARRYPATAVPLLFTSNHDENSWSGSEWERMGPAVRAMAALTFLLPGMPLLYTGQEVGCRKRLAFFDKDFAGDTDLEGFTPFYKELIALKKRCPALDEPPYGAPLQRIENTAPSLVLSFARGEGPERVCVAVNGSPYEVTVQFKDLFVPNNPYYTVQLPPFGYHIVTP